MERRTVQTSVVTLALLGCCAYSNGPTIEQRDMHRPAVSVPKPHQSPPLPKHIPAPSAPLKTMERLQPPVHAIGHHIYTYETSDNLLSLGTGEVTKMSDGSVDLSMDVHQDDTAISLHATDVECLPNGSIDGLVSATFKTSSRNIWYAAQEMYLRPSVTSRLGEYCVVNTAAFTDNAPFDKLMPLMAEIIRKTPPPPIHTA